MTGHAAANLARRTSAGADWEDAHRRLTRAVDEFDQATHARARALCISRLALLHHDAGDHDTGVALARQALATVGQTRSARLVRHLKAIQATANAHPDTSLLRELAADIEAVVAAPRTDRPADPDAAAGGTPAAEPRPIAPLTEVGG